jgi:hypothetical protein
MSYLRATFVATLLSLLPPGLAQAADQPVKAMAKKKAADLPFFLLIDDRVSFSWMPKGTDPGVFSVRPDGGINGTTAKQVYSFTHFDIWAYGTNFFTISMFKSDHNDPANPCTGPGVVFNPGTGIATQANCAGATDIYGLFRSTFGWNEIFETRAFTYGPLRNISFEVGMDAGAANTLFAYGKRSTVAGLQFAFDLPYKGYFNIAPLAYWEFSNHDTFIQCGGGFAAGPVPGTSCVLDGERHYNPTWAVEMNYYMDLGFLPENMQFWSISGRAAWYGPKGTEANPLPYSAPGNIRTVVEFNSEPIRLTFDASKAMWGAKYSHFVDLWVSYRYWQNKLGIDHSNSIYCNARPGVSNNSCTESTVYSGITMKF